MGVHVNDWYSDPAQRYNDVIYPQKDRVQREKDWERIDRRPPKAERKEPTAEQKLSPAAQKLLEKLKRNYKNVDFSVAESNDSDDARAKLAGGTKQYSVLFTNDELEMMAKDTTYRSMMTQRMGEAFRTITLEKDKLKDGGIDPKTGNAVKNLSVTGNIYGNYSVKKGFTDRAEAPSFSADTHMNRPENRPQPPKRPEPPKKPRTPERPHTDRHHTPQRPHTNRHGAHAERAVARREHFKG